MPRASPSSTPPAASRSVTVRTGNARPAAKGKAPAPIAAPGTRSVTVPQPEDFKHAEKDALLQLKIGRSAHLYAIMASTALALDGFLLLFFYSVLPTLAAGDTGTVALEHSFFLIFPLLAGLALAGIGLASKWEEFQLWPWETHFSVTVAALAANVLLAIVYGLRIAGEAPFATTSLFPWFYAAELAGISLALVGITLTWSGWSARQWVSALSAVLPVASALFVYFPPATTRGIPDALVVSLFVSAIFYQTSGSFLHLISSGTRPHERELITSGQSRMFHMADDLRQREDALSFREAALVKRESDVENSVLSIKRQNDSLTEARTQLDGLEDDYRKRSDAVSAKEREWAGKVAEMESRRRLVEDKTKALELREQEVARLLPQISSRETRLVEREGEQTKRDVELTQREQSLVPREAAATEADARIESRRKELDQKTQEMLRREGDLNARETMPPGAAGPTPAAQDLANRETKLKQLQAMLDEQNLQLGKKARETAASAKAVEAGRKASAEKEAALASREAALGQREAQLADLEKAAQDQRTRYESASKDYAGRLEEYGVRAAAVAQKDADLDQRLRAVTERESAATDRETRLKATLGQLERREAALTTREASVRATEAEVSLRSQAMARGSDLSRTGAAAVATPGAVGLPSPSSARDRAVRPSPGGAVRDLSEGPGGAAAPDAETLATPVGRRLADRLPSGTPRLDDLLLGGFPPKGHVVLLGDAFVGKEVVLYSFVGEGLKRGEPAVLITASRSPTEVSESLGVVLPQFREFEQMGMVRWVDASGSGASPDDRHVVLKSSDDRAGILSNLVQVANAFDGKKPSSFRVAFLGLSAVLAHGDERASFSFLQNVVGILKPRNALAMYSLEAGALSEAQVETLLGRMDGAIVFRQDRDRLFLSVKGFGEVETREWIECRATQRQLIVGSFALERIR